MMFLLTSTALQTQLSHPSTGSEVSIRPDLLVAAQSLERSSTVAQL
jgi:hypothetical protein